MAGGREDKRKDTSIVLILQEQFCTSELSKVIQDAVLLSLHYRTMSWFRTVSSSTFITSDVQSIYIPSKIQDWYREDKIWAKRTHGILSACGSYGQRTRGSWEVRLGSTASCTIHAQSMEETPKYGVLGRHQTCLKERIEVLSDAIERHHPLRHTPSLLYPESCCSDGNWRSQKREGRCVTSASSKDFLETWLDERFGFRSCSTTRRISCATSKKVPKSTQTVIERRNLLFALKEECTILRKSNHILFVKKLWDTIEQETCFCRDENHERPMFSALSEHLTHVSLVKVRT